MLCCGGLNLLGGLAYHNSRRFIMPILIAIIVSINVHIWWIGATCLLASPCLCIGYGEKSFLWKYFNDFWGRFIWMVLVSLGFTLGLMVLHHLAVWIGIVYIIGNGILGSTLRKINEIISESLFGITLASFILFVF